MLSRALSIATVTLLAGCLTAVAVRAVENLEAGKTPSQIFAGTCNACHKSPRGLLKSVPASSLPGFLRQHYTTSSDMASVLASFLVSNGATDTRYQSKEQPKTDMAKQKDAKQDAKPDGKPDQLDRFGRKQQPAGAQEVSKPDADGLTPQGEGRGRDGKRLARPGQAPDGTKPDTIKPTDGQAPVQASTDSKSGAKQKLGKRGRPGEEPPKTDEAAKTEAAKTEAAKTETAKSDVGKSEGDKSEAAKPAADATKPAGEATKPAEGKSETAKVDAPKANGGSEPAPLRPDPVPMVTPAPPASATATSGTSEPAASPAAAPPSMAPPAVTASAPPAPPAAPAGPPTPPISQ